MVQINKLEELAARLNQESDSINETIKAIQEKINSLNPGLEVWLDNDGFSADALAISNPEKNQDGNIVLRKTYLGYSKLNNKWALAIKVEDVVEFWDQDMQQNDTRIEDTEYSHLLEASRQIRIAALEKMQKLINTIADRAEGSSETIEKAKKVAEKI